MTLKEQYQKNIIPELEKEFGINNKHNVPCLSKVVVNIGLGRKSQLANFTDKLLPAIIKELSLIVGQAPSQRLAKKSIAGFKLREGQLVGLMVTLRGNRMYEFVDKLVKIVYPRVRDFKGVDLKNVDKNGNLNLGFRENVVFPEIVSDQSTADFGLQVTLVTKAKNRDQAVALYNKIGFLFKKPKTAKKIK